MSINVAGKKYPITCDSCYFATATDEFLSSLLSLSHIS